MGDRAAASSDLLLHLPLGLIQSGLEYPGAVIYPRVYPYCSLVVFLGTETSPAGTTKNSDLYEG